MHIERVQVEEGFLDGLDVDFEAGLNVLIGARGTGKTSLIELIRFCLDARSYTAETAKRSHDHALSVLGSGQVTVTLSAGTEKIVVSRSADDERPRSSGFFAPPIVFSQTEIETVGLQPGGRLQLLDGFIGDRRQTDAAEAEAASVVRSLTAEVDGLRREIDEFAQRLAGLEAINKQIAELAPQEQQLAKLSANAAEKKTRLDALSGSIASSAVALATIERFQQGVARWRATVSRGRSYGI